MKTFVVLSDSHGKRGNVNKLRPLFEENSYIVHLGDGASDMREISALYPEKTFVMKGNCDFFAALDEYIIEAEGVRILCCHGHRYGVKSNLYRLAAAAKEKDCKVALYGHTHNASVDEVDGVLCVNPGALGSYISPSYCYLVVHAGKATATIVPVK